MNAVPRFDSVQPPLVLDGAMGTELKRRGVPLNQSCWSAPANLDRPELVQQIHEDYLLAGADVITTNTMMAGKYVLEASGIADFEAVNHSSVQIAQKARQQAGCNRTLIAGSISILPPMDNAQRFLHGKALGDSYRNQASVLKDAGADVLIAEMLIDSRCLHEVLQACCECGLPVWAGLSARRFPHTKPLMAFRQPGTLLDEVHETFEQIVKAAVEYPLEMIGVMHTDLADMSDALSILSHSWSGPTMAYGNIGQAESHDWLFTNDIDADAYVDAALDWTQSFQLQAIGGCCGTTPDHIRLLSNKLKSDSVLPQE